MEGSLFINTAANYVGISSFLRYLSQRQMGMLAVIFISKKPKCSFGTPTSVPGLTARGLECMFVGT